MFARAVLAVLFVSPVVSGDIFLVYVGQASDGKDLYKRIDALTDIPLGESRVLRVVGPSPDPGPGPGDPIPPISVEGKVKSITVRLITNEVERQAILAILKILQDRDEANLQEDLTNAIELIQINSTLFPDSKSGQWLAEVLPLAGGNVTKAFITQVEAGVSMTLRGNIAIVQSLIFAAKGNVAALRQVERLDLIRLLEFIRMILQLFGLLPDGAISQSIYHGIELLVVTAVSRGGLC